MPHRQRAETVQSRLPNFCLEPEHHKSLQHPEEEPADPAVPTAALCKSIFLVAPTESKDLPADPDYAIQVRRVRPSSLHLLTQALV